MSEQNFEQLVRNKALVGRIFDEVWTGNIALIDEICGEDFVYHGAGAYAEIRGTDHTKTALVGARAAFPDLKIVVDQVIAEGDRVVQRYTFSGTHTGEGYGGLAPTGKRITAKGIIISRVRGGKIVEQWESYDHLGMMKQMGLIPAAGEEPARTDSSGTNKAIVDRVFDEIYNNGNLDIIEQLFSADFLLHMPGREVRGPDGVRDMVTVTRNGFPDIHFAIEDAFAAGDRVVHRYTITGTHLADWHALPKTGKQVSGIQGHCVSRLVGGKVVEMWELDDSLSLLQQLGLVTLSAPMPRS